MCSRVQHASYWINVNNTFTCQCIYNQFACSTAGNKWLPFTGYTLPVFNRDQSNGLMVIILNRINEIRATVLIRPPLLEQSRLSWKKYRKILSSPAMAAIYFFLYNFSYLMTPCSEKRCFVRVGIAGQTAWAHTQAYKPDTQLKKTHTQPSNKSVQCSVNGVFSCATAAPLLRGCCCRCTAVKTAKRVWDRAGAACDSCLSLFCTVF